MTVKEAEAIIKEAIASMRLTLREHQVLAQALNILATAAVVGEKSLLKPEEKNAGKPG